jgi:nitrogen-specific signal transduction histidine kinase
MEDEKISHDVSKELKELALSYMKILIDVARESFLILDTNLQVISANPIFYQVFHVSSDQTENKFIYELGNGQWNIPVFKSLLENILPEKKIIKDYEVTHVFETIGEKTMLLNAKQIDTVQLIILAIEDITDRKQLEEKLADYTKELEVKVTQRTEELADRVKELETLNKNMVGRELKMMELKKEIEICKKQIKNGNGKNGNGKNGNGNGNHING